MPAKEAARAGDQHVRAPHRSIVAIFLERFEAWCDRLIHGVWPRSAQRPLERR
jgi:hypothetical protein